MSQAPFDGLPGEAGARPIIGARTSRSAGKGIPPFENASGWPTRLIPLGFLAIALCAAAVLFFFDPSQHGFYPSCLFYRTTGLQCPGCGSLRALHSLLHGELARALHYNALLVLSLPCLTVIALRSAVRWFKPPVQNEPLPARFFWVALAALLVFTVVRNLLRLGNWLAF
jgi:hypothetical protein